MARRIHVMLIDDVDQTAADETVTFALDGAQAAASPPAPLRPRARAARNWPRSATGRAPQDM